MALLVSLLVQAPVAFRIREALFQAGRLQEVRAIDLRLVGPVAVGAGGDEQAEAEAFDLVVELLVQEENVKRAAQELPHDLCWPQAQCLDCCPIHMSCNVEGDVKNAALSDVDAPAMPEIVDRAVPGAERLGRLIGVPVTRAPAEQWSVLTFTGADDFPDLAPPFPQAFVVGVRLPPFPLRGYTLWCFRGFLAENLFQRCE